MDSPVIATLDLACEKAIDLVKVESLKDNLNRTN
tara:strand:+ start:1699 stop:1800 length:102 start_codon:yes stop_codon:yes gene_type:complete